ncbi:MAG: hypothetical protein A2046_05635 [Bacteroidetes bacterium GWA2_30_7]|nr:MAG: hypothetical protein A2046_05635 [Bacteroidetes bacterium GWA2_30_7]
MKNILIIIITFLSFSCYSQTNDESQLAMEYYRNKEYDKASEIYIKLYNKNKVKIYYNYYLYCLFELKEFDEAEKFVKKEIKKAPEDLTLLVDYGFIFKSKSQPDEANKQFDNAIKKIMPDQVQIINLANAFISKRENEYAELTYLKGRKLIRDNYPFNLELANLYEIQRNYQKMIDEYLDLLTISDSYIQTVQNRLNNTIYSDSDSSLVKILKSSIIKRVQKYSDVSIYSELLIWLYIQDKDFKNAFTYSKSLDKRNKESGERIISLARIAASNLAYEIALECYKYVIDKDKDGDFFIVAKNEYLNTLYQKIIIANDYSESEIIELEKSYLLTLNELGQQASTISLIKELSYIQTFYLNKSDEAIARLEKAITISGIKPSYVFEAKLVLADIYLYSGDLWTAAIYYAQVEKSNENSPIGYEAKFKKSKLAYYSGDFKWAEAQLDVLKASTSKLIANDAFYLSSIINDNTALDTITTPLEMYSRAELSIFRNNDSLAELILDSIAKQYPTHSLSDDIVFLKSKICEKSKNYNKAVEYLEKIVKDYSYDILADDALYEMAKIYDYQLNDKPKAMEAYKEILIKYPGSIYVVYSRKRYRILRGDVVGKDSGFNNQS